MYFYKLERTVEGTGEKPEIETPLRSCDLVVTVAGQGAYLSHTDNTPFHDDVIKWKHFPRYWPFVRGIHRSPVNSPHKGQWRGALKFSLICVWINGWVNNRKAGDVRRYRAHCDVSVMQKKYETGGLWDLWYCWIQFTVFPKPKAPVESVYDDLVNVKTTQLDVSCIAWQPLDDFTEEFNPI